MHFRVEHSTRYVFPNPVHLGPHTVRLRPRTDGSLHVKQYALRVQPQPTMQSETIDLEGNLVTQLCFDGEAHALALTSSFEGSVRRMNPFDYVVTDPNVLKLPGPGAVSTGLAAAYTRRRCRSAEVAAFAADIAHEAGWATLPFLSELAVRISSFTHYSRLQGNAHNACETLQRREGACRDLAVLYVEACRSQGLPARFVSGYWRSLRPDERRDLHAWAEVYLPGGGWRGYDPVCGLAVADTHMAVAASADPRDSAPVSGSHDGSTVDANLIWDIRIQTR